MFYIFFSLLILQRLTELVIAKRNEKWMLSRGGIEYGSDHYRYIVALHVFFLLSFLFEVLIFQREVTAFWYLLIPILIVTQMIRYWALLSLGSYWNTKIIIVPNEIVISRGPYQFLKHPNYMIVAVEILLIPLLFQAYVTALVFTILNIVMMIIRIPTEEKALKEHTNYQEAFNLKSRFVPKR
ncbi:isoprenylcysteine carboxyl methyltransferase family protein [Metabacillus litoralis]|uniref:isoprenylcysteine carboxyl methyltransferase family protein n=1 Tax=Metabacillus litoralis TaxID=152268 RepID=UPI001CFD15AD|nr:isoprenylcysteine carboxylmethyltransferase family protein [Metabacillus litoralis]